MEQELRALIRKYIQEILKESKEYDDLFRKTLDKFGVSSPDELSDEKKKEFFDYLDANWEGDKEVAETTSSGAAGPYMTPHAWVPKGKDHHKSRAARAMDWEVVKRIDEGKDFKFKWAFKEFGRSAAEGMDVITANNEKEALKKLKKKLKGRRHLSDYSLNDLETKIVKESVDFKSPDFNSKQKIAQAVRSIREYLKEVEKLVDKSRTFKESEGIKSADMYKRTHAALRKIGEQTTRIINKIQGIK